MIALHAIARLIRRAISALFSVETSDCYGCHLDNQWVGSDLSDHTCSRVRK